MNLHLHFIASYVILSGCKLNTLLLDAWQNVHKVHGMHRHTHAANNNNIFVWFWSGAYREWPLWSILVHYCNMHAAVWKRIGWKSISQHSNDFRISLAWQQPQQSTYTHARIHFICWYFPLPIPLLALSFSHPKMHLHFSLPTNLYAVCLEFVFIQQCLNHFKNRVYFDDDREKSENSSVRATKQEVEFHRSFALSLLSAHYLGYPKAYLFN